MLAQGPTQSVVGNFTLVTIIVLLFGCTSVNQTDTYEPNPPDSSIRAIPLNVAVVEFEDKSPSGFKLDSDFVPPGYLYKVQSDIYLPTTFGACLTLELRQSRIFKVVNYFRDWDQITNDARRYDVIVTGSLNYDRYRHKQWAYGLSTPFVSFFCLLGIPCESYSRDTNFEIVAFLPNQPDVIVWRHLIEFDDSRMQSLYAMKWDGMTVTSYVPKGGRCTTKLLQPQMLTLRTSLAAAAQDSGSLGSAAKKSHIH